MLDIATNGPKTAEINGASLHYNVIGKGPALLLMHGGLGLDHTYFRPYFDQLAQTHSVIFYDHYANGRSERPEDFSALTFDRLTSDAAGLLDHLGVDKAVVIGHSYGGFIAQKFAASYQDRLSGLVLIDTVPAFDYEPTVSGNDEQMAAFGKLFTQPMTSDDEFRQTWGKVIEMYFAEYDDSIGRKLDEATHYSHNAWNVAGGLLGTFNTLEDLPGISVPALVITGEKDPITPVGPGGARLAELLPNAQFAIFENSAHYPFIEEEKPFFTSLNNWLENL